MPTLERTRPTTTRPITPPPDDLDERIAAAFADSASKDQVRGLIRETSAAVEVIEEAARRAQAHAHDPMLSMSEAAQARREADDIAFRHSRLRAAADRLRDRLQELRDNEKDAHHRALYEAAKADRDRLAEELAELYPSLTEKLLNLLTRLAASDRAIGGVNGQLPRGAPQLLHAEQQARGLQGPGFGGNVASITRDLRLPSWRSDAPHPFAWPPRG
jgi:hypothetical protein